MCLPNPTQDYDDFVARTGEFRDAGGTGTGTGMAPSEPFSGVYYGVCTTEFSSDDPERVFRFYTKVDYTTDAPPVVLMDASTPMTSMDASSDADPDASSSDSGSSSDASLSTPVVEAGPPKAVVGTLSLSIAAMRGRVAGIRTPPTEVSESTKVGATIMGTGAVASDGRYRVGLGELVIGEEGNAVQPRDVKLSEIFMDGRLSDSSKFCANLVGNLTLPVMATLTPALNVCVFLRVNEGDPLPANPEFVCQ